VKYLKTKILEIRTLYQDCIKILNGVQLIGFKLLIFNTLSKKVPKKHVF